MQLSQILLPLIAALLLSTFGMPWLAFAGERHSSPSGTLRSRWVLFTWLHPFWSAVLRWSAIVSLVIVVASVVWR